MAKRSITTLLVLTLAFVATCDADLTVLDFDDLSGQAQLPIGYGGLNWNTNWTYYDWSQYPYTPSSPPTRIFTHNYGGWIDFSPLGVPVTFEGAYFAGASFATTHFEGYIGGSGGTLVGTSATLAPSSTPTFLPANFGGPVDYVNVVCDSYDYFVMDDVTYQPVPAPTAVLLGVLGLGAAGIKLRRFA
jgi:hypothetical protein